jgi:CheY-like chemotaxis protein
MIDFLVVEDTESKYLAVKEFIESITHSSHIKNVTSVSSSTALMRHSQYTFLIIDINLPMLDDGTAEKNGGIRILNWLKHNKKKKGACKVPLNIIVLSEYDNLIDQYKDDFDNSRVFAYKYSEFDKNWQIDLKEIIEDHLLKMESSIEKKKLNKVVFSVHGINTYGEWQEKFSDFLKEKDDKIEHFPYKYSYYPVLSFLIPPLRKYEVNNFKKELEFFTNKYPSTSISIVGHSFGTYLIAQSLKEIELSISPKVDNIILCGSVLKPDYNWSDILTRHKISKVLNDCALNDGALLLSQAVAIKLGMAGRVGFIGSYAGIVNNRYFNGGHSCFFDSIIFDDWYNFLNNSIERKHDERKTLTVCDSIINSIILYLPFIMLALIVFGVDWLFF